MSKRILTDAERANLTCKPCDLNEVREQAVSQARLAEMIATGPALYFESTRSLRTAPLDCEIAARERDGDDRMEFLACDRRTGALYLVNTEGYDYARYLGRVSISGIGRT